MREVTRGVQIAGKRLRSLAGGDLTLWTSSAEPARLPAAPSVLLLPNYDEYFIAYKDRAAFVGARDSGAPQPIATDPFSHVLAIGGGFGGTWRRTLEKKRVSVEVKAAYPLAAGAVKALTNESVRFGAFLGAAVHVSYR
jgi:hypothetical protein